MAPAAPPYSFIMDDSPSSPPPTSPAAPEARRALRVRPRIPNAWLILAIVIVFGAGVVMSGAGGKVIDKLYGPAALIIVVILIIQYILLKGRDRSRVYKIEIERMRAKRHDDIERTRHIDAELANLEQRLHRLTETGGFDAAPTDEVNAIQKSLDAMRRDLSEGL
jgi:DNA-binding helix-hairpin-helix protein with protein kinase domain